MNFSYPRLTQSATQRLNLFIPLYLVPGRRGDPGNEAAVFFFAILRSTILFPEARILRTETIR